MIQAKFSLKEDQIQFLELHRDYGFKDKSSLVRAALNLIKKELEVKELEASAQLYAEIYEEDQELKNLTESALTEWPK